MICWRANVVITDLYFSEQWAVAEIGRACIYAIYDIFCTTDTGEKNNWEMQNRPGLFLRNVLCIIFPMPLSVRVWGESWKFDIKAVYEFLHQFPVGREPSCAPMLYWQTVRPENCFRINWGKSLSHWPLFNKTETEWNGFLNVGYLY